MPFSGYRRAPRWAPFLFLLLAAGSAAANCPADHYDELAVVAKVFDGDTLMLEDGRRLRLIGVNTPELAHRGRNAEPLSGEASRRLRALAAPGSRIRLRYGQQRRDRYRRLLAHVFRLDGDNITARLLEEGLGAAVQISPNFWALDCYLAAERRARKRKRGIWGHPHFRPLDASRLPADAGGFHFVRGVLSRVGESRRALWLNLGEGFALRIANDDRRYFRQYDFGALTGRELVARGWLYRVRGRWRMNLHHPAALEIGTLPEK